ncbi:MAG: endonuclease III [Lentisphaerae bacterium]|nr:endonuclease III [Lentisphaerota bacterium]
MKMSDMPELARLLKKEFLKSKAPITELDRVRGSSPFHILVTTILSARTKDETTSSVVERLFKKIKKSDDFRHVSLGELEKLIYPIGFFRTKAKHLKELPDVLDAKFKGVVPSTIEELCELPGVGRKTANLVLTDAFDKPAICVDVHVHRICNRLGLIKTKSPTETEMVLRKELPIKYWKPFNKHLVSFGQTTCLPRNPKCDICPVYHLCKRVFN